MVGNGNTAPFRLVGPSSHVAHDLRLATALFTPEESASEGSLVTIISHSTHVLRSPVVVAELVVALQVQLIVDVIALLQIAKGAA